jgi:hypothetical protein
MSNEATKKQIRDWIEGAIRESKNPDLRKILKKKRELRKKEIIKNYGY